MQSIDPEYMRKKANQLGLERGQMLEQIQVVLGQRYGQNVRAVSLNNGVLKVITPSAGLASNLRLDQVGLLDELKTKAIEPNRLQIVIAPL